MCGQSIQRRDGERGGELVHYGKYRCGSAGKGATVRNMIERQNRYLRKRQNATGKKHRDPGRWGTEGGGRWKARAGLHQSKSGRQNSPAMAEPTLAPPTRSMRPKSTFTMRSTCCSRWYVWCSVRLAGQRRLPCAPSPPPHEGGQRRTAKRWALPGEMAQPRAVVLFTSEAGTNGSCDAEVPCWRLLGRQLLGWSSDIRRSQGRGGLSPFSEIDPLLTDSAVAGCREVGLGVGLFRHDQQPLRLVALELHAVAQEGTHLLLRDPDDRLGRRAAKAARPRTAGDPQHRPSTLACPIHPEGVSALPEVVGVFASCIVVGRSCDVPLADETRMGDGAPQETNKNVTKLAHFEKSMPTNSTETPFFGVAPDPNRRQPCKGSELC